jgi:membrane protein implicated in regulation of membrane protease activity
MQEWLFWTGLLTFSLLLIMALFAWYFSFVLLTVVIGVATYVWARFIRFPPMIAVYNEQLRRARFFSQSRYKHPEATIRARRTRRRR